MRTFSYSLILCSILVALCACHRGETSTYMSTVNKADHALATGDMAQAVKLCDNLSQSADTSFLSWKDYCKMAAIYAIAYDNDYMTDESMASATLCLAKARSMQPDSVSVYINDFPAAQSVALNTVAQTLDGLNTDHSDILDHEGDDLDSQEENESHSAS